MENKKFCQSCGMPMEKESDFGTNADVSKNKEYCCYCYKDGAFPDPEMTMEDMIAFNLKFNEENNYPMGPQEEAKRMMEQWFPTLKRWKA
ncbi:MAG: zinc ribbon domain-containing protein [Lachnospiraceae bacterium]